MSLIEAFAGKIHSGLKRRSYTTCSRWAEGCRVVRSSFYSGPWRFTYHPWEREMHDSNAQRNIGQKSAQVGFTDTVLNRTLFNMDIRGMDCLYVLPSKSPDASDFSAGRFNAAIELSPYLSRLFTNVQNVGHKVAGTANLYIRGGRARGGLKSIPVGGLVLDEVDEMPEENIPLAFERSSGQKEKEAWLISTPTIPRHGINIYFENSTQNHFFFPCPHCHRRIELKWPESIVITGEHFDEASLKQSHLICYECRTELPHQSKHEWLSEGRWVSAHDNRDDVGWYINQLYSPTISPYELAQAFLKGRYDKGYEQEFYNSKLGLPHVVDGSSLTDVELSRAIKGYKSGPRPKSLVTMGVDVGWPFCYYEIDSWQLGPVIGSDPNINARPRVIETGIVQSFDSLVEKMRQHNVRFCVVDAQPERRAALEFAMKCYGKVRLCFYAMDVAGKLIHITQESQAEIRVDRTAWLDLSLGRFRAGTIHLPCDISVDYRKHLKSLVRIYKKPTKKADAINSVSAPLSAIYVNDGPDHFAHARNYAEIALPLALGIGSVENIKPVY